MSEPLQDLIEKIKKEGVEQAQDLSRSIEATAHKKAQQIIAQAQKEADEIITNAQQQQQKLSQVTHIALKQASRDMILNLRKEINATLQKIVTLNVKTALTPQNLAAIIGDAVCGYLKNAPTAQGVVVGVAPDDFKKLQEQFLAQLIERCQQPLTLKPGENISGGFTISFDGGKSFFDFTDESLAAYLSASVHEDLAALMKEARLP